MVEYERECRLQECTNLYKCNADKIILENAYFKLNADGENNLRRTQPLFETTEGQNEKLKTLVLRRGNIVIVVVYSMSSKMSE
jgi:hypothetical protein